MMSTLIMKPLPDGEVSLIHLCEDVDEWHKEWKAKEAER